MNEDAIRQVFVVGPMKAGGVIWQFHTAGASLGRDGVWRVDDRYVGRTLTIQQWYEHMAESSMDGKLRLYVTDSQRFTHMIPEYTRVQLGMDLARERDWYKGYFRDMFNEMKKDFHTIMS